MKNKNKRIPIYIILFCIFLTLISIYYEDQKKAAVLGDISSIENIDE